MACHSLAIPAIFLAILWGCGDDPGTTGGSFNWGGSSGAGGAAGTAGTAGSGGMAGNGGSAGSGGLAGSGGSAGSGGMAGSGGSAGSCVTNSLCRSCPDPEPFACVDDGDCFTGWVCIPSGCETNEGSSMNQCQPSPGGVCTDSGDCLPGYECRNVPLKGLRCVKTTPGCNDDYDCVFGFSCEGSTCVDRRVPCVIDDDCPMGHSCEGTGTRFCARVHRTCYDPFDCGTVAPFCVDIDGDGRKECAGAPNSESSACVNSDCAIPTAPVCEVSLVGSMTVCGQYGLCLDNANCAAGFECVALWPDGRKECVLSGLRDCSQITDCPQQQVCASPRFGGTPSCQAGSVP